MAERYTKVFTQQGQFYCVSAPIVIQAGALLKDNQTGKILAQVKFKSISPKNIQALTVRIAAWDVSGKAVAGVDEFQYLDLNIQRGGEFGQKTPIFLPNAVARSFVCQCLAAVFDDGTVWNWNQENAWAKLPSPDLLSIKLDTDLIDQYRRSTTKQAKYIPAACKDLWYCTCGEINQNSEDVCFSCYSKKTALVAALDLDSLKTNAAAHQRMIAQKQAAEAEVEAQRARKKKITLITALAALSLALIVLVSYIVVSNHPATKYKQAVELMDSGDYVAAQEILAEISTHKDAAQLYDECQWQQGLALFIKGDYEGAYEFWNPIEMRGGTPPKSVVTAAEEYLHQTAFAYIQNGQYEQAISETAYAFGNMTVQIKVFEAIYQKAVEYKEIKDYEQAISIFEILGEYSDSNDKIAEINTLILKEEKEEQYQLAISCINVDNAKAYELFVGLADYKDSSQYASRFKFLLVSAADEQGTYATYSYDWSDSGKLVSMTIHTPKTSPSEKTYYFDENLHVTGMVESPGFRDQTVYSNFEYTLDADGRITKYSYNYSRTGTNNSQESFMNSGSIVYYFSYGSLDRMVNEWSYRSPSFSKGPKTDTYYSDDYTFTYTNGGQCIETMTSGRYTYSYTYEVYYDIPFGSLEIPAYQALYFIK